MLIYFLYRLLTALAFPLILLYLLRRGLRDKRYWRGLGERFGKQRASWFATLPGGIWLHAVSVGEVVSSLELLRQLRAAFPSQRLYVSVTTVAGRQIAEEKLSGLADHIFYSPLDVCWIVRRVLRYLRPQLIVVMETEIWPNLFREAKRFGCGLIVVNGRISDRAYPQYLRHRWFFRSVLHWPDAILVQNEIAAERYLALGAPPDKVTVNGNLKYDFRAAELQPPAPIQALCSRIQPSAICIAASTMPPAADGDPDEDDVVIDTFQQLRSKHSGLLLILVPRRPERFDSAAQKLAAAGIPFLRRSQLDSTSQLPLPGVLLLDTMGELAALFPIADIVFMGGTLAQRGGHNILEPGFFAKPIVIGPHMENFPDIAAEFRQQQAVFDIAGPAELAPAITRLLDDPTLRQAIGERARLIAESKRGATARAVQAILTTYSQALPRRVQPWPIVALLWPLSRLWTLGLNIDRWRKFRHRARLQAPVISIGGIAMGGTGKTPLVGWLAEQLALNGHTPAILTRGYRRRSPEKQTILAPGESCPIAITGDEAQIFLRAGHAALGIGADRVATGRRLEQRFHPTAILLDDGLQHWRLDRTLDIVALDALSPFAGGAVFPLGMLRESPTALGRASAFVITRFDMPRPWTELERQIHAFQPAAPIFYAHIQPGAWIDASTSTPIRSLPQQPVAAFCGLGNPASFWATLRHLHLAPVFEWAFPDHQNYRPRHLASLAHQAKVRGADILLTTEKDAMNLPADYAQHLDGARLYYLRTRFVMDDPQRFLAWILPHIT